MARKPKPVVVAKNVSENPVIDKGASIDDLLGELANAKGNRKEQKRIRRRLRAKGHFGGLRQRVTHDERVDATPAPGTPLVAIDAKKPANKGKRAAKGVTNAPAAA